jgi:hypothetical protein
MTGESHPISLSASTIEIEQEHRIQAVISYYNRLLSLAAAVIIHSSIHPPFRHVSQAIQERKRDLFMKFTGIYFASESTASSALNLQAIEKFNQHVSQLVSNPF